jgi:KaiC/GvpD/RAD55 family RecA-like ATPase
MDDRTLPLFASEKEHAESVVNKLRTRDQFDERNIIVVDSMTDLELKIKAKFGIHSTEI